MATFTSTVTLPADRETVATWFSRPGALTRATPHWSGSVLREGDPNSPGSRSELRAALPFSAGLLTLPWEAEHLASSSYRFTDRQKRGPFSRWQHTHEFGADGQQTVMRDTVTFELPAGGGGRGGALAPLRQRIERSGEKAVERHLEKVFAARERRISADLTFQQRYAHEPLTVVLAGASGMVGRQLSALLTGGGHRVRTLVRRAPGAEGEFFWDPSQGRIDSAVFAGADAVIHLGGATISQRFTQKNKRAIMDSRVDSTALLARSLADLAGRGGPRTFICASAVGFYGHDRGDTLLTEESGAGSGFLADVCAAWEGATRPAREAGLRVVNVRTGLVQSVLGGMLRLQLPLFLSGTGGWVGDGSQIQSWISLDDIAGVYVHALFTEGLEGPVNAVAPEPVTARELAKTVGAVVRRPVLLPIPKVGPSLLLKREGAEELALASQNVSAQKLLESGYVFFEPTLRRALEHELVG